MRAFERTPLLAAVWIVYLSGAAIAAAALSRNATLALALPAALVALVAATAALGFPRR